MSCLTAVISAPLSLWLSKGGFFSPVRWASWPDDDDDGDDRGGDDDDGDDGGGDDNDGDDDEQDELAHQTTDPGPVVGLQASRLQQAGVPLVRPRTRAGGGEAVVVVVVVVVAVVVLWQL